MWILTCTSFVIVAIIAYVLVCLYQVERQIISSNLVDEPINPPAVRGGICYERYERENQCASDSMNEFISTEIQELNKIGKRVYKKKTTKKASKKKIKASK